MPRNGRSWTNVATFPSGARPQTADWSYDWSVNTATYGDHTLSVRATDSAGIVQPDDQVWTYYGVANNGVARMEVVVA